MRYLLPENLGILLCAAAGFICGAIRYLRPKKPLYASMIVLGLGCVLLGRLYQCVRLLTGSTLTEQFQIGVLGAAGAFSFFFSSNYGQIDSLVDDGGTEFLRYRTLAWTGPIAIGALFAPIAAGPGSLSFKLGCGVAAAFIAPACYFHVKHLIIPDVDYGVVRCQRGYNCLALCMGLFSMLELIALSWRAEWLFLISGIALGGVCLLIAPVMDQGVKKWMA